MSRVKPTNPVVNRSHPLARGLVLAWAYWEGGGESVSDISGHGRDGAPFPTTPSWAITESGQTSIQSSNGWQTPDDSVWSDHAAYTWYSRFRIPNVTGIKTWLMKGDYSPRNWSYAFRTNGSAAQLFVTSSTSDLGTNYGTAPSGTFVANEWASIVVVWDGSGSANADRLKLYKDGTEISLTYTGTITSVMADSGDVLQTAKWEGHGFPFLGDVADTRIWSRALLPGEIADLYARPFDLYKPAIGTFERYYERVAPPSAGQPEFKRWGQRTNQPIFGRGF